MHPYITWEIVRQQQRDVRTRARAARATHLSAGVPQPSALRRGAALTLRRMADQLEPSC